MVSNHSKKVNGQEFSRTRNRTSQKQNAPLAALDHALRVAPHNAMRLGRRVSAGFRLMRQRADAERLAESHGQQRRGLVERRGQVGAELVQV